MSGQRTHRRLRAPGDSGGIFIQPSLDQLSSLVESNRRLFDTARVEMCGFSLSNLRRLGITQLVRLALQYSRSYRDVRMADRLVGQTPLILSGHQPQLFHPGVWFKNFALARSWQLPAIAVHLIIDNDVCLHPSIRVPRGSIEDPRTETIPYDAAHHEVPYEERRVRDRHTFDAFAGRVTDAIASLVSHPLLREFWPLATARLRETDHLGLSLSQARHQLEGQWHRNTLELPLSRICQTEPFRIFTLCLLREHDRMRRDYNQALSDFRRANRIRSRSHPVPGLVAHDAGCETPFWVWTRLSPNRRRLFARAQGRDLQLSDGAGLHETIHGGMVDVDHALTRLAQLEEKQGIKIRPRALATTMFARLVLSDLFFHGIGGAKYDQLTDEIIRRFFGMQPPQFVTMTATLQLPLALPATTADDVRLAAGRIRDAEYHPENFIDHKSAPRDVLDLLAEKEYWTRQSPPRGQRAQRHREIARTNVALRKLIDDQRVELRKSLEELRANLRRKSILASREFSFCLFPRESFDDLLLELS